MMVFSALRSTQLLLLLVVACCCSDQTVAQCVPQSGCNATAIYITASGDLLFDIANRFGMNGDYSTLQILNNISDPTSLLPGQPLRVPFSCDCGSSTSPNPAALGHSFTYPVQSSPSELLSTIASSDYGNLTRAAWIAAASPSQITNAGSANASAANGVILSIPVNCSCGNPDVSPDYGLFATYVWQPDDSLSRLSTRFNISQSLLTSYNPTVSFDQLQPFVSIIFIPVQNSSGQFPPFVSPESALATNGSGGINRGILWGAIAGGVAAALAAVGFGIWLFRTKFSEEHKKLADPHQTLLVSDHHTSDSFGVKESSLSLSSSHDFGMSPGGSLIEFSYSELAAMTSNFNISKEIGRGGFATVFFGEFRSQRVAIKKMSSTETKGFISEMRILSSVHHANLVQLVGYCTEGHLFLVYEFVDNGSLTRHLHPDRNGTQVLSWEKRVQIALDAAKGIEYMHEHTKPTYIHRDIKPSNILIDTNYHAKVGDFGLTKFIDPDSTGGNTTSRQMGTYGYMPPEYGHGQVSVKMDVYAFGVVLFQIVSAKEALIDSPEGKRDLASLFRNFLEEPNAREQLHALVDPALGNNYSSEMAWKMIVLAERCTNPQPELRPPMTEVVLELAGMST